MGKPKPNTKHKKNYIKIPYPNFPIVADFAKKILFYLQIYCHVLKKNENAKTCNSFKRYKKFHLKWGNSNTDYSQ